MVIVLSFKNFSCTLTNVRTTDRIQKAFSGFLYRIGKYSNFFILLAFFAFWVKCKCDSPTLAGL